VRWAQFSVEQLAVFPDCELHYSVDPIVIRGVPANSEGKYESVPLLTRQQPFQTGVELFPPALDYWTHAVNPGNRDCVLPKLGNVDAKQLGQSILRPQASWIYAQRACQDCHCVGRYVILGLFGLRQSIPTVDFGGVCSAHAFQELFEAGRRHHFGEWTNHHVA
jgi:hypothetical protein